MQLGELADKVGISSSALSQIEKSKSFPSILTLKTIADKLHTTVGDLVGENESMGDNHVVLQSEIKYVEQNKSGTILFMLSNHDANKQMDTYLLRFAKASGIEGLLQNAHGQVFCHVLSGEFRFDLNNKTYVLNQGDNIYFSAKQPHNILNNNDGLSELLWIQSPASY